MLIYCADQRERESQCRPVVRTALLSLEINFQREGKVSGQAGDGHHYSNWQENSG